MKPTHEIYYVIDNDIVGTATILEDGDLSITINGNFVGIFASFDMWNLSGDYALRKINQELNFLEDQTRQNVIDLDDIEIDVDYSDWLNDLDQHNLNSNKPMDFDLSDDQDYSVKDQANKSNNLKVLELTKQDIDHWIKADKDRFILPPMPKVGDSIAFLWSGKNYEIHPGSEFDNIQGMNHKIAVDTQVPLLELMYIDLLHGWVVR